MTEHVHGWGRNSLTGGWECCCGATSRLEPWDAAAVKLLAARGDGASTALMGTLLDGNAEVEREVAE